MMDAVSTDESDATYKGFTSIPAEQLPVMFTKTFCTLDNKLPPFQPPKLPTATGKTRDDSILKNTDEKFKQILAKRKAIDNQYKDILQDGIITALFERWKRQIKPKPEGASKAKHSKKSNKPFKPCYCEVETVKLVKEVKPRWNQDDREVITTQRKINSFLKDCHAFLELADTIREEMQRQKSDVTKWELKYTENSELVEGINQMCKYIQEFKEDIASLLYEFTDEMYLSLTSDYV